MWVEWSVGGAADLAEGNTESGFHVGMVCAYIIALIQFLCFANKKFTRIGKGMDNSVTVAFSRTNRPWRNGPKSHPPPASP
jgi:hypothetical protein